MPKGQTVVSLSFLLDWGSIKCYNNKNDYKKERNLMIVDTQKITKLFADKTISNSKIAKLSGLTKTTIARYRDSEDYDSLKLSSIQALMRAYNQIYNTPQTFNLITDKWIPVFHNNSEEELSLKELFELANENDHMQLIGDSHPQELALLRLLLAIVQTVYPNKTIQEKLKAKGSFDNKIIEYLLNSKDKFDMFGKQPFYQVTLDEFNSLVADKDKIKPGKTSGVVAIKQLNRTISESENSPNVFAPKTKATKNDLTMSELVRWLITYQNFTGSTDKVKVKLDHNFKKSVGWTYKLNPVYIRGNNLFDTLIANLVNDNNIQKPFWDWEINEYVAQIETVPNNIAQLYTLQSRLIHIMWNEQTPVIYTAALPIPSLVEADVEPMTTWRISKKGERIPDMKSLNDINNDLIFELDKVTGQFSNKIIKNLATLPEKQWYLINTNYLNDGNATSQLPSFEYYSELPITKEVLQNNNELVKISQTLQKTIKAYWQLQINLNQLRGLSNAQQRANLLVNQFKKELKRLYYHQLIYDLDNWQIQLEDDIRTYININVEHLISPSDLHRQREEHPQTIFDSLTLFYNQINKILKKEEEENGQ